MNTVKASKITVNSHAVWQSWLNEVACVDCPKKSATLRHAFEQIVNGWGQKPAAQHIHDLYHTDNWIELDMLAYGN